jgi:hypothetical protein
MSEGGPMPIYVQSEIRRIEQTTLPGEARAQALTQLGNRLVAAMGQTEDLREQYKLRVMNNHVMRMAEDERRATP